MKLSLRRRQLGQGMTEYIIIVALVAVAAIGTYQFLGKSIRGQTAGIASEIAGESAGDGIAIAEGAASEALIEADKNKGLANYDDHAHGDN